MKPVVNGLVQKYAGRYDIRVMNTSQDAEARRLAGTYQVEGVPWFVFLNADGSQSGTVRGAVPAAVLEAELTKLK
jgi:thiol:disulfide interchange protein